MRTIPAGFRSSGRWGMPSAVCLAGVCVLILGAPDALAEPLFSESRAFDTGQYPFAVAAADLNHDGRVDVVVANRGSNTLSVLLGVGRGVFAPHTQFATGAGPSSVAIADLDGDGQLDLVATNSAANSVSVLRGTGDGRFLTHIEIPAGIGVSRVVVAELDGDGRPDIATLNGGVNNISVLHGNGDGSFGAAATYPVGITPSALAVGDLNGDHRADLVTTNQFGAPVSVLLARPDGTFAPQIQVRFIALNPSALALADMDGDHVLDLVVASTGFDVVSVLHGNGDGSFVPMVDLAIGLGPYALVAADLDADGGTDLAVANIFSSTVAVQRRSSPTEFMEDGYLVGGEYPADVIAADVNADGKLDLISANNLSNTISVFLSRTEVVSMGLRIRHDRIDQHPGHDRGTAELQPPAPFKASDIDIATIRLNGTVAVDANAGVSVEDRDHDGIPELRVRFDRQALIRTLAPGSETAVTVTGTIAGREFVGADTIRVRAHRGGDGPIASQGMIGQSGFAIRAGEVSLTVVNPSPRSRLGFDLSWPRGERATLHVLDVAGRQVSLRRFDAGGGAVRHIEWPEAARFKPGVYFLRLTTEQAEHVVRRVVLE